MKFQPYLKSMISTIQRLGITLVFIVTAFIPLQAQADVLVSPLRVLMDKNNTTATVTLRNPSDGPRTYRLEWLEQKVNSEGGYIQYEEGEKVEHATASPFLRISPRQITVAPKSNQKVRVLFRPRPDMPNGEYRSHLLFKVVPELSEPMSTTESSPGKGINFRLSMQLSISIPVIVRHNVSPPQVKLSSITPLPITEPGERRKLAVVIERSGESSSYGQVVVEMQKDANSPVQNIGRVEGINVFADAPSRRLTIPLQINEIPSGSWLRVAYEGATEYAGVLWDEQVFQIR